VDLHGFLESREIVVVPDLVEGWNTELRSPYGQEWVLVTFDPYRRRRSISRL
jgi:hypothetical protein